MSRDPRKDRAAKRKRRESNERWKREDERWMREHGLFIDWRELWRAGMLVRLAARFDKTTEEWEQGGMDE
jgi:hypothetical protein